VFIAAFLERDLDKSIRRTSQWLVVFVLPSTTPFRLYSLLYFM